MNILLAIDEEIFDCLNKDFREEAKADAQKMVEEYKECIYDLVFAYVNKDEDFPHGFEIETLKDAIKLSEKAKEFLDNEYFIQNYLGE